MSALVLFALAGTWLLLGYLIWLAAIARFVKSQSARVSLGLALVAIWSVAPWADEWIGAREFKRLCDELPEVTFSGPFDESGARKLWTQREIEDGESPFPTGDIKLAYAEGRRFSEAWQREFRRTTAPQRVRDWPIPVLHETTTYTHAASRKVVLDSQWIGSPGGWMRRLSGWGNQAPHSCAKQSKPYPEASWIAF